MSARTTALVVERELREAARRKSVWALVGLIFLGSVALVVLPEVIPDDDSATVAIVGDDLEQVARQVLDRLFGRAPASSRTIARVGRWSKNRPVSR